MKKMKKVENKKNLVLGCVAGRHEIPQVKDGYLFEVVENVHDFESIRKGVETRLQWAEKVSLYVTGLTAVTAEVVAFCAKNGVELTLHHFDRETGEYIPQVVVSSREAWEITTIKAETYGL